MRIGEIEAHLIEVLGVELAPLPAGASTEADEHGSPDSDRLDEAADLRLELDARGLGTRDREILQRSLEAIEAAENQSATFKRCVGAFVDRRSILKELVLRSGARKAVIESLCEALMRVSLALRRRLPGDLRRNGQAELLMGSVDSRLQAWWKGAEDESLDLAELGADYLQPALEGLRGLADSKAASRRLGELLARDLLEHGGLLPAFAAPVMKEGVVSLFWRQETHPVAGPDAVEVLLSAKAPSIATLLDRFQQGVYHCKQAPNKPLPDMAAVAAVAVGLAAVTSSTPLNCVDFLLRLVTQRYTACVHEEQEGAQARMAHLLSLAQDYRATLVKEPAARAR